MKDEEKESSFQMRRHLLMIYISDSVISDISHSWSTVSLESGVELKQLSLVYINIV